MIIIIIIIIIIINNIIIIIINIIIISSSRIYLFIGVGIEIVLLARDHPVLKVMTFKKSQFLDAGRWAMVFLWHFATRIAPGKSKRPLDHTP